MVKLASLIIALCKAIPALAGLFHAVSDGLREVQAGRRLDAKNAAVDAAVDAAVRVRDGEAGQRANPDEETRLFSGGTSGPGVGTSGAPKHQ